MEWCAPSCRRFIMHTTLDHIAPRIPFSNSFGSETTCMGTFCVRPCLVHRRKRHLVVSKRIFHALVVMPDGPFRVKENHTHDNPFH